MKDRGAHCWCCSLIIGWWNYGDDDCDGNSNNSNNDGDGDEGIIKYYFVGCWRASISGGVRVMILVVAHLGAFGTCHSQALAIPPGQLFFLREEDKK